MPERKARKTHDPDRQYWINHYLKEWDTKQTDLVGYVARMEKEIKKFKEERAKP